MSDCHAKALLEVVLRKTFNGHSELCIFEQVGEICEVARNPVHIGSEQFPGLGEAVCEWYVLNQANLARVRSDEHTYELQPLMGNSYAVFCLKKKTDNNPHDNAQIKLNTNTLQPRLRRQSPTDRK